MQPSTAPAVLHVADYGGTYSGNFIASLRALAGPCRSMGFRVALAFSRCAEDRPWLDRLRRDGFPVHLLPGRTNVWHRSRAIADIAARERALVIHSHYATYDVPAALAARSRRRRLPVVWHAHTELPKRRPLGAVAKDAIKLRVVGRTVRLAAVSPAIVEEAIRHGFPAGRVAYIPNGSALAHATATDAGRAATRRALELPDDANVVLAFGWDPEVKGIDVALDAMAALPPAANLVLVVVGGSALRSHVDERHRGVRPGWLRIVPPREHVADLHAAADLFLSSSRTEGFSYALGEALANGV